ncbi:hypothetical protein MA16_Dca008617 [Dendrobium catenatum]|uniref:Uncharacterized protein n=1 Tax=Dendrobium catenatum TaxID=906689 RepID=A0A2I0WA74_9ASPA|nr:hypothetical protein MA16_Dca008617 [Dendrobium catenatum]
MDSLNIKCLIRNFFVKWWSAIIVGDKKKHIDKVIQNNLIKTQRQPPVAEFSLKNLQKMFKQHYPHESPEQIKVHLQKAYWEQMTQLFPNDEEMASQRSDDTIPDTWNHPSLKAEDAGLSHRPGKAPLSEET